MAQDILATEYEAEPLVTLDAARGMAILALAAHEPQDDGATGTPLSSPWRPHDAEPHEPHEPQGGSDDG